MLKYTQPHNLKPNTNNPRSITTDKYNKLVNSIREFPKMLELRPLVVDENMVVLGGNMRLKAITEAGVTNVPYIQVNDLTEEKKQEFIIKDNLGYGEWDWDIITAEWDTELLDEWGMDVIEHNWEQLDYIEDEVEQDELSKDTKVTIIIPQGYEVDEIKDNLKELLNSYPGCEIK